MKNKCGAYGAMVVFIVGVVCLVSCSTSDIRQESDQKPLPTQTPIPLTSSPEHQVDPSAARSFVEATVSLPTEAKTATKLPTPFPVTHTPAATDVPTRAGNEPTFIRHSVRPGDTLLGLAQHYSVSMAAIQLANGMKDAIGLIAGQTLAVPSSSQWFQENSFWIVHIVRAGDTLVDIASSYGLTVDDILRVNAIADPGLIQIEQQLVMPVTQLVTTEKSQPIPAPAHVGEAPASTPAQVASSENGTNTSPGTASETDVPVTATVTAPVPTPSGGPSDWPAYILGRINAVRADNGLNTLTHVAELSQAAQAHAEDCVRRGWGSHVGSDGAVLKTRLERAGYFGLNSGENWVQARNAVRAFEWWYGEIPPNDPHRRNILGSRYTEIGIGIAYNGSSYIFVTDFGRR